MFRKFFALFTALLLLLTALPALAEEAGAVTTGPADGFVPAPFVPVPEDFLGTWTALYAVVDGAVDSKVAGMTFTIYDDNTMTNVYGESSFPYTITGDTLTVSGALMQIVAPNLLVARSTSNNSNVSLVVQRTAAPENPFLGEWIPLVGAGGGEVITTPDDIQARLRFEAASIVLVAANGSELTAPCVYTGGVCRIDADGIEIIASIDEAGLMTYSCPGFGTVYLLIRAE